MGHTVRLRGEFWPQDHWGRVTNAAIPREQISQPALEAADEAVDMALERYGDGLHSAYLSGPAARGRPGGAAVFILLRLGAMSGPNRNKENWNTPFPLSCAGAIRAWAASRSPCSTGRTFLPLMAPSRRHVSAWP